MSTAVKVPPPAVIASPCTGVCRLDGASGYCLGCGRSREEIAGWRTGTVEWRTTVWERLPARLDRLKVTARRLPWLADDIAAFVEKSLRGRAGTWVFGVHGAVAEFSSDLGETLAVSNSDGRIEAVTGRGAVRFHIHDGVRALTLQRGPATVVIALAVPKERLSLPVHEGLAALGPDQEAIRPADRGAHRFDLGLGRASARFTVRLASTALHASLEAAEGAPLTALLVSHGAALLAESPNRVVESAVGRVEVTVPIPFPGSRSPSGPHTHLLPGQLATKRETAPGLDLPDAYALGAIFHPLEAE